MIGLIKEESYNKLGDYICSQILSRDQVERIWHAKNCRQLYEALSIYPVFKEDDINRIWKHVIENEWVGVLSPEDRDTVFTKYELIFFRELLKNQGILSRKSSTDRYFKTNFINDETARSLEEREIIDIIKLKNYEVIYILSPNFYRKVMQSEK